MTTTIRIADTTGAFCSGGELAASIRVSQIEPFLSEGVCVDFAGVRTMNSSFCNSLVAELARHIGPCVVTKLRFTNCNDTVKSLIRSALNIGLSTYSPDAIVGQ